MGCPRHHAADSWSNEESAAAALWEQSTAGLCSPTPKHQETIGTGQNKFPRDQGGSIGILHVWGFASSLQVTKKHGIGENSKTQKGEYTRNNF